MNRRRLSGLTLMEAMLALTLVAGAFALAIPAAGKVARARHAQDTLASVRDLVSALHSQYGHSGAGYPAGVAVAQALWDKGLAPGVAFDADTGCYTLEGTTDLCLNVPDAGNGRGPEAELEYRQAVGGTRAETCRLLVDNLQQVAIAMEVGADEPVDAQGYYLHGADWTAFWNPRCKQAITITFVLA